jgi:hypothetical protein
MKHLQLAILAVLLASSLTFGQNSIPVGTILPLRLNSSLNSKNSKPGKIITARLMQDVSLPSGSKIRAGAKAIGHVIDVSPARDTRGGRVSFQFDALVISKQRVPIPTNLRAVASMMDVNDTQIPKAGLDGDSGDTEQIGGEVVYRDGGPVMNGSTIVGKAVAGGVIARVASVPGTKCRESIASNDRPQSLWVFSTDACGTYGFSDLTIEHSGRTNPIGEIVLASSRGDFNVLGGSGLLLRVVSTQ